VFGVVMEGVERVFERMVREHQHRVIRLRAATEVKGGEQRGEGHAKDDEEDIEEDA